MIGVIVRDDGPVMVTNARGLMPEVDVARGGRACANPDVDRGVEIRPWGDKPPFPVTAQAGGKTYGFESNEGACRFLGCEARGQTCAILETCPAAVAKRAAAALK